MFKKVWVIWFLGVALMIGLMVMGQAEAEIAADFDSPIECIEQMGYESKQFDRETMMNFVYADDIEGLYSYLYEKLDIGEDEDMYVIRLGEGAFPGLGFVFSASERDIPLMNRTILRIYYLEVI